MSNYSRLTPEQQQKITESDFLRLPLNIQSILVAAATGFINVDEILAVLNEAEANREKNHNVRLDTGGYESFKF